jgi:hypothetical protein
MKPAIEHIDVSREELDQLLERARTALAEDDYRKLKAAVDALSYLTELVADKDTTIRDLRQLLLPPSTEKTRDVLKNAGLETSPKPDEPAAGESTPEPDKNEKKKKPGHGRNGADAYQGGRRVEVAHEKLKPGDRCPGCLKGKVYQQQEPRLLVRIVGQAPIAARSLRASRLALQSLRRHLHGGRAGRRRRGQVRRDGGGDDRGVEVWQRDAILPAGEAGRRNGDSAAALDAMGDRGGSGGVDQTGSG